MGISSHKEKSSFARKWRIIRRKKLTSVWTGKGMWENLKDELMTYAAEINLSSIHTRIGKYG